MGCLLIDQSVIRLHSTDPTAQHPSFKHKDILIKFKKENTNL